MILCLFVRVFNFTNRKQTTKRPISSHLMNKLLVAWNRRLFCCIWCVWFVYGDTLKVFGYFTVLSGICLKYILISLNHYKCNEINIIEMTYITLLMGSDASSINSSSTVTHLNNLIQYELWEVIVESAFSVILCIFNFTEFSDVVWYDWNLKITLYGYINELECNIFYCKQLLEVFF